MDCARDRGNLSGLLVGSLSCWSLRFELFSPQTDQRVKDMHDMLPKDGVQSQGRFLGRFRGSFPIRSSTSV